MIKALLFSITVGFLTSGGCYALASKYNVNYDLTLWFYIATFLLTAFFSYLTYTYCSNKFCELRKEQGY